MFSHSKSMETIDPRGVVKFYPRGMIGPIHVDNLIKVRLLALEILMFECLPIVSLWRLSIPRDGAKFDPKGTIGTFYNGDY